MGPIGCPEKSVSNYHYLLHNNPEQHSSHLLRGGSAESRREKQFLGESLVTHAATYGLRITAAAVRRV
jgi:hypothetical protein